MPGVSFVTATLGRAEVTVLALPPFALLHQTSNSKTGLPPLSASPTFSVSLVGDLARNFVTTGLPGTPGTEHLGCGSAP